ncbi:hypothetical protein COOONC_15338 [Cooperia oncophora]
MFDSVAEPLYTRMLARTSHQKRTTVEILRVTEENINGGVHRAAPKKAKKKKAESRKKKRAKQKAGVRKALEDYLASQMTTTTEETDKMSEMLSERPTNLSGTFMSGTSSTSSTQAKKRKKGRRK